MGDKKKTKDRKEKKEARRKKKLEEVEDVAERKVETKSTKPDFLKPDTPMRVDDDARKYVDANKIPNLMQFMVNSWLREGSEDPLLYFITFLASRCKKEELTGIGLELTLGEEMPVPHPSNARWRSCAKSWRTAFDGIPIAQSDTTGSKRASPKRRNNVPEGPLPLGKH